MKNQVLNKSQSSGITDYQYYFTLKQTTLKWIREKIFTIISYFGQKSFYQSFSSRKYLYFFINDQSLMSEVQYHYILKYIKSWNITKFCRPHILYFCRDNIINQIIHINFTNLIQLDLSSNSISSVEPLAWLDACKLQKLSIWDNQIKSLKTLFSKCFWKDLSALDIKNAILESNHDQLIYINRLSSRKMFLFRVYNHHFENQVKRKMSSSYPNISQYNFSSTLASVNQLAKLQSNIVINTMIFDRFLTKYYYSSTIQALNQKFIKTKNKTIVKSQQMFNDIQQWLNLWVWMHDRLYKEINEQNKIEKNEK